MRVTDDDYKKILDFCTDYKTSNEIATLIRESHGYTSNLLSRMQKDGYIEIKQIPYRGQHRNQYKTMPEAYKLLANRKQRKLDNIKLRDEKRRIEAKERARNKQALKEKHKKIMSMMTDEWQRPDYFAQAFNTTSSAMGKTLDAIMQDGKIEKSTITVGKYSKVVYRKKKKEPGLRKVSFSSERMQEKLKELDELYRGDRATSMSKQKYSPAGSTLNELG